MDTNPAFVDQRVRRLYEDTSYWSVIEFFRNECRLRNLTTCTVAAYLDRFDRWFRWLDANEVQLHDVQREHVRQYLLSLAGSSPATINGRLIAIRRLYGFLIDEGLMAGPNPTDRIKPVKQPRKIKAILSPEDMQRLIGRMPRGTFLRDRDLVLVLLLWDGMLRVGEALTLNPGHVDSEARRIRVTGKGRKERFVPLTHRVIARVTRYKARWSDYCTNEYLIPSRTKKPLTGHRANRIVKMAGRRAGLRVNPHLIRHSAISHYANQPGANLRHLQLIVGHESLSTTESYMHGGEKAARESYEQFSPARGLKI